MLVRHQVTHQHRTLHFPEQPDAQPAGYTSASKLVIASSTERTSGTSWVR